VAIALLLAIGKDEIFYCDLSQASLHWRQIVIKVLHLKDVLWLFVKGTLPMEQEQTQKKQDLPRNKDIFLWL